MCWVLTPIDCSYYLDAKTKNITEIVQQKSKIELEALVLQLLNTLHNDCN